MAKRYKEPLLGKLFPVRKGMCLKATQTKRIGGLTDIFEYVIEGHEYKVVRFQKNEAIIKSKQTKETFYIPKKLYTGSLSLFKRC